MDDVAAGAIFDALGHPVRRRVVAALAWWGTMTASIIAANLPDSTAEVTEQLAVLCEAGLVRSVPAGRDVHHSLIPTRINEATAWIIRSAPADDDGTQKGDDRLSLINRSLGGHS